VRSQWLGNLSSPTLELLQVYCFDVSTRQVLYVGQEGVGIASGLLWEPRNEGLKVGVGP
jgi:hypothetical protein